MGLTDYLVNLVKFCILDAAVINGTPLEDLIGTVSKEVKYNDFSTVIETTIDETDISRYHSEKSDNRHAFTLA